MLITYENYVKWENVVTVSSIKTIWKSHYTKYANINIFAIQYIVQKSMYQANILWMSLDHQEVTNFCYNKRYNGVVISLYLHHEEFDGWSLWTLMHPLLVNFKFRLTRYYLFNIQKHFN